MSTEVTFSPANEHLRRLDQIAGVWDAHVSAWGPDGSGPFESGGVMINRWIVGGHFLEQRYEGAMGDQPFLGAGMWGYNPHTEAYEAVWVDNMGFQLQIERGRFESDGGYVAESEPFHPMIGAAVRQRSTVAFESPDVHTMVHELHLEGAWRKTLEIRFTRRG